MIYRKKIYKKKIYKKKTLKYIQNTKSNIEI